MSGDVRSLEEVIAAAELEWLASVKGSQSETRAEWIAAAVLEWCIAPPQGERAAKALWEQQNPLEAAGQARGAVGWDRLDRELQTVAWHDAGRVAGGYGRHAMTGRLFGWARWLVLVPAHVVLAVSGWCRPPSPGIEHQPPPDAYNET